jgi:hypothetical protein
VCAVVTAIVVLVRERARCDLTSRAYLRFLSTPWRLATFAFAGGFFVLAAPLTGDPTWDRVDGALMAGLTFLTAPWAVGALFRARSKLPPRQAFAAACAWLLSASWCYDGYLLLRDGRYPSTWWSNLAASSVLYACAGLFWNVTHRDDRGVVFAFMLDDWLVPVPLGRGRWKVAAVAAIFAAFVTAMMLPFVWEPMVAALRRR